jgi:hypothetical protein
MTHRETCANTDAADVACLWSTSGTTDTPCVLVSRRDADRGLSPQTTRETLEEGLDPGQKIRGSGGVERCPVRTIPSLAPLAFCSGQAAFGRAFGV